MEMEKRRQAAEAARKKAEALKRKKEAEIKALHEKERLRKIAEEKKEQMTIKAERQ